MNDPADFFLPPALVARALASLAEHEHDAIDRLTDQPDQGEPSVKEELTFRLRDYEAFLKASYQWGTGVRPVLTPHGSWLVPSRTQGGVIHEISREGGYWRCGPTCKAKQFHWHSALILGIERAMELADEEDDGDADACETCEGAGCSECDGSELTDDEIAEQTSPFAVWDAAQPAFHSPLTAAAEAIQARDEAVLALNDRIAKARAAALAFNTELFAA